MALLETKGCERAVMHHRQFPTKPAFSCNRARRPGSLFSATILQSRICTYFCLCARILQFFSCNVRGGGAHDR
jgi:hypothetical protein